MSIQSKLLVLVLSLSVAFLASIGIYFSIRAPIVTIEKEEQYLLDINTSITIEQAQIGKLVTGYFKNEKDNFLINAESTMKAFEKIGQMQVLPTITSDMKTYLDIIVNLKDNIERYSNELMTAYDRIIGYGNELSINGNFFNFFTSPKAQAHPDIEKIHAQLLNFIFLSSNVNNILDTSHMIINEQFTKIEEEVGHIEKRSQTISLIIIAALIVTAIIFAIMMTRKIAHNTRIIEKAMERIKEGDLTVQFDVASKDEIGHLGKNLALFVRDLNQSVTDIQAASSRTIAVKEELLTSTVETSASADQIKKHTTNMISVAEKLSSTIEQSFDATETITDNIAKLGNQILEQTSMVEESTASVTQMIATVENIARMTQKNREASERLVKAAETGREKLSMMISVVKGINETVGTIREMANIIQNISAQTNLLAMNAAIEAAHAGQYGKGFAVVADEIRKLAEASGKSTKDITLTLKQMLNKIDEATESSEVTTQAFAQIGNEVESVSRSLAEIHGSTTELSSGGEQILKAMASLRDVSAHVNEGSQAMSESSKAVDQSMTLVKEISTDVFAVFQEISKGVEDISAAIDNVKRLAIDVGTVSEDLDTAVHRFKTVAAEEETHYDGPEEVQDVEVVQATVTEH